MCKHLCVGAEVCSLLKRLSTSLMCGGTESSFVMQAEADSRNLGSYEGIEQVQASLQVGAKTRQVIMEGVLQLQVLFGAVITCSVVCAGSLMGPCCAKIAIVKASAHVKHQHLLLCASCPIQ